MPIDPQMLTVEQRDGLTIVTLQYAEMRHAVRAQELQRSLTELVEAEPGQTMLIDFQNVQEISSAILGVLIVIRRDLQTDRGSLVLCSLRPQVLGAFRLTRLDQVFSIQPDRAAAQQAALGQG